jgi:hypothetical protein
MSMKFVLQARRGRRFRRVDAAGFGTWTTSEPGVARYVYTRRVESLLPGARYRVKVRFRWHDGAGEKLAQARGRSRACRQPDPRPNLRIDDLFAEGGRHVAVGRNDGREAADTFAVRVGDAEVWLDGLAPGRTRRIEVAAACEPGADVVAEADPGDRVDERSERDNTSTLTCA